MARPRPHHAPTAAIIVGRHWQGMRVIVVVILVDVLCTGSKVGAPRASIVYALAPAGGGAWNGRSLKTIWMVCSTSMPPSAISVPCRKRTPPSG